MLLAGTSAFRLCVNTERSAKQVLRRWPSQQYELALGKLMAPTLEDIGGRCRAVCGHRQQVLPQHNCVVSADARRQLRLSPSGPRALEDVEHMRKELSSQRLQQARPACTAIVCLSGFQLEQ